MSLLGFPSGRWPVGASLLAALTMSAVAAFSLKNLVIDGGIYDLLNPDDPVSAEFNSLARVTPGLEELIVVCEPESGLRNSDLESLAALPDVDAHTRTYVRPGLSSVYAFSLETDPANWRQSQPILESVGEELARAGADCGLTGTPAVVYEIQNELNGDLLHALLIAIVLVVCLFAFIYRIAWLAIIMLVPVFLGIAWGLAAYVHVRGELTLLAATVPTLLVGIGIDHCIHLIQSTRYHLDHDGLSRDAAILTAWRNLLRPISVATLTTAAAFGSLTVAQLRGLADLGWAGMFVTIGVYLSCLTLVPVALKFSARSWLERHTVLAPGLRRLAGAIAGHRRQILLVTGIALCIAAALAPNLHFLDDNRKLQTADLPSLLLQDRVALEHELSASPILIRFVDEMDAIELQADPERPASIASLPSVRELPGLVQVHTVENAFVMKHYNDAIADIDTWIERLGLGDYSVNGAPRLNARIDEVIKTDVATVPTVAVFAVLAVLVIGTRSFVRPVLVLLPLVAALLWLGAGMSVAGVAASLVTVAALPLVIGIGVDGGVHMIAARHRHDGDINRMYADTGVAVLVTILTSMLAFAAFVFVRSPAMVQFGSQVAFALCGILLATLVVLPLLLGAREQDA